MEKTKTQRRIIFNTHEELYQEVKRKAESQGQTIRRWMTQTILDRIKQEAEYE